MDIETVSTAIMDSLTGLGLHRYDYGPDAVIPPAGYVYPEPNLDYHATFGYANHAATTATFIVRFLCASVMTAGGQAQLNALISPAGAPAAIELDPTLGGVVDSAIVTGLREYGVVMLPDSATRYNSAELVIEIFA